MAAGRQKMKDEDHAATKIQAVFRGRAVRRQKRGQQVQKNVIPSKSPRTTPSPSRRGTKVMPKPTADEDHAATKIQAVFRGRAVRRQKRGQQVQKNVVPSKSPRTTPSPSRRGTKALAKPAPTVVDEDHAATKIQAMFRGRAVRRQQSVKEVEGGQEGRMAARLRAKAMLKAQDNMEAAVTRIQSLWRGGRVRTAVEKRRAAREDVNIHPTLFFPHATARQAQEQRDEGEKQGAILAEYSATKIQASFRGRRARKEAAQKRRHIHQQYKAYCAKNEERAAVKIQAATRGRQTRQEVKERQRAAREAANARRDEERAAAVKIQARHRGNRVRAARAARRAEQQRETEAAVQIQRVYRGSSVRRRGPQRRRCESPTRVMRGVTRFQALFRAYTVRKEVREYYSDRRRRATLRLRAAWQGYVDRERVAVLAMACFRQTSAGLSVHMAPATSWGVRLIQRAGRGFAARTVLRALHAPQRAARRLQGFFRMLTARAECERRRRNGEARRGGVVSLHMLWHMHARDHRVVAGAPRPHDRKHGYCVLGEVGSVFEKPTPRSVSADLLVPLHTAYSEMRQDSMLVPRSLLDGTDDVNPPLPADYHDAGVVGYVYPVWRPGLVPLVVAYSAARRDSLPLVTREARFIAAQSRHYGAPYVYRHTAGYILRRNAAAGAGRVLVRAPVPPPRPVPLLTPTPEPHARSLVPTPTPPPPRQQRPAPPPSRRPPLRDGAGGVVLGRRPVPAAAQELVVVREGKGGVVAIRGEAKLTATQQQEMTARLHDKPAAKALRRRKMIAQQAQRLIDRRRNPHRYALSLAAETSVVQRLYTDARAKETEHAYELQEKYLQEAPRVVLSMGAEKDFIDRLDNLGEWLEYRREQRLEGLCVPKSRLTRSAAWLRMHAAEIHASVEPHLRTPIPPHTVPPGQEFIRVHTAEAEVHRAA
eukprot:TRINITY_DN6384_c0_g1_i1.p1 TRINITY_DN6384_c0_g1~~TRINITY_DN6384_c0_g1_i1.p1  ORF type:complete len:934 (+),score=231.56 TRINITY_DN6384_c0_g1_i1:145-2946(+)